jgi:hypothetical protein
MRAEQQAIGIARSCRLLVLVALAYYFFFVPHAVTGDAFVRLQALTALLERGARTYTPYSLVAPLVASPLWALGHVWHSPVWWLGRFNVLVLAAGLLLLHPLLRPMREPQRACALLLLAIGSMFPNPTRDFYGETFTAVTVAVGFFAVANGRARLGWIVAAIGVANMGGTLVGLALAGLWLAWRYRRFDGLAATVIAALFIAFESWMVRGSVFLTGYEGNHGFKTNLPYSGLEGFSYPLPLGVLSLLFSLGKGLLFFAPGLLLLPKALRGADKRIVLALELSIAFVVGLLIVYSRWWAWYGGWKWGPRFLLFASVPAAVAIAHALGTTHSLRARAGVLGIAAWSVWVGMSGVAFDLSGLGECTARGYAMEYLCWYVPEYSPLIRPLLGFYPYAPWQTAGLAIGLAGILAIAAWLRQPLPVHEPEPPE